MKSNAVFWEQYLALLERKKLVPIAKLLLLQARRPARRRGLGLVASKNKSVSDAELKLIVEEILTYAKEKNETKKESKTMDGLKHLIEKTNKLTKIAKAAGFQTTEKKPDNAIEAEKQLVMLGMMFLTAAKCDDSETVALFLENGFPVNFQEPRTKKTVAHCAATQSAAKTMSLLLTRDDCDFLLRDSRGQLAYDISYAFARYPDTGDQDMPSINSRLLEATLAQAKSQNVEIQFKYGSGGKIEPGM